MEVFMSLPLDACNLVVRLDSIERSCSWERFEKEMGQYWGPACSDGLIFKLSTNNPGMMWKGLEEKLTALGLKENKDYVIDDFFSGNISCSWAEIYAGEFGGRIRMKGVEAPDVKHDEFIMHNKAC